MYDFRILGNCKASETFKWTFLFVYSNWMCVKFSRVKYLGFYMRKDAKRTDINQNIVEERRIIFSYCVKATSSNWWFKPNLLSVLCQEFHFFSFAELIWIEVVSYELELSIRIIFFKVVECFCSVSYAVCIVYIYPFALRWNITEVDNEVKVDSKR